jgi:hypothetical protein
MEQHEAVPGASHFGGYEMHEKPPAPTEIPELARPSESPADWLARHWTLLVALVAIGIAWGTLSASVGRKLDRDEYAKDQAARAERQASRDSVAGQTLTEVKRIGNYLCRKDPGAC